jgi:hypothetical protein
MQNTKMKKALARTILIFLMTASIIACSKDEETTSPVSIVGKWGIINEKSKITRNGQIIEDTTIIPTNHSIMEFYSNGVGIIDNDLFRYTFSGTTILILSMNNQDTVDFNNSYVTATTLKLGRSGSWVENGDNYYGEESYNFIKLQ